MEKESGFYPPMSQDEIKSRMQELEQAIATNEAAHASSEDMTELHARYEELQSRLKESSETEEVTEHDLAA